MQNQTESVVEELLRERREEVAREDAEEAAYRARPGGPVTREQLRAKLAAMEARQAQRRAQREYEATPQRRAA